MFGVDTTELLIVAVAALIFIGPKDLPVAMRTVGRWVGQIRGHARHFTAGIENMMREAELEEMEKSWREENDRIMRDHPVAVPYVGADPSTALATSGPSTELGTSGQTTIPTTRFVPSEDEAPGLNFAAPLPSEDEPPLPLAAPAHHHRDLP